jgi:hypothetical protein
MFSLSRLSGSVRQLTGKVTSSAGRLSGLNQSALLTFEQLIGGFTAAILLCLIGHYLPFWVTPVALLAGGAIGWRRGSRLYLATATFLATGVLYYFLGQPVLVLYLVAFMGVSAAGFTFWRVRWGLPVGKLVTLLGRGPFWLRLIGTFVSIICSKFVVRSLAALTVLVLVPTVTFGIYYAAYTMVAPGMISYSQGLQPLLPLLSMIPTLLIASYYHFRQPLDRKSSYWIVTPVLATLFCVCFWPAHTHFGMAVVLLTAITLSVYAFVDRPNGASSKRSHGSYTALLTAGAVFSLLYIVSNSWQGFYNYQMANAVDVQEEGAGGLEQTVNNRLVPRIAAPDYCMGNNQETVTTISSSPHPIVIKNGPNGADRFYWECIRHPDATALKDRPTLLLSHPLVLTGGAQGAMLVDAGERGRYGEPITTEFVFGEDSIFTRGAFYWRHPGAIPQPGMIALTEDHQAYVVIPYTTKVLQWGAMVPAVSGVMTISPSGFIQDLLPSQAAAKFPGVVFNPSDLERQYADKWGHYASFWSMFVTGEQYEVSEIAAGTGNAYPYQEDFKNIGLKGVINFEPVGTQQNSWVRIGLFDRATLSMKVVRVDDLKLTGPKQLLLNAANARHPGLFQVTAGEPLLAISPNRCIFLLVSLMQQGNTSYHGYSSNTITDGHGQHYNDVDSEAEVDNLLASVGNSCVTATGNPAQ